MCSDFREVIEAGQPRQDDFVYLDPPYVPISRTASFTAYAQRAFGPDDQQRLADLLGALSRDRVPAVLSNSYCRATLRLYQGLDHQKVPVRRAINFGRSPARPNPRDPGAHRRDHRRGRRGVACYGPAP